METVSDEIKNILFSTKTEKHLGPHHKSTKTEKRKSDLLYFSISYNCLYIKLHKTIRVCLWGVTWSEPSQKPWKQISGDDSEMNFCK